MGVMISRQLHLLQTCPTDSGPAGGRWYLSLGAENSPITLSFQGQILAVWSLAAKLPNSDLSFAVDFWGGFLPPFFPKENPHKSHPKFWSEKFPSDFCGSLFLISIMRNDLLIGESSGGLSQLPNQ